jgi:hypothetical protein
MISVVPGVREARGWMLGTGMGIVEGLVDFTNYIPDKNTDICFVVHVCLYLRERLVVVYISPLFHSSSLHLQQKTIHKIHSHS